jgi:hypothetical protein
MQQSRNRNFARDGVTLGYVRNSNGSVAASPRSGYFLRDKVSAEMI